MIMMVHLYSRNFALVLSRSFLCSLNPALPSEPLPKSGHLLLFSALLVFDSLLTPFVQCMAFPPQGDFREWDPPLSGMSAQAVLAGLERDSARRTPFRIACIQYRFSTYPATA